MALRVVHRPTRTTHPAPAEESREVEAPPTLPDGKSQGNPLMAILPMVGMMASLTIMMVMRNPAFMALGAVVLCVALLGALLMLFSRRGQVGRQRRNQRELYLQYLEELRERLSTWEKQTRAHARLLDPPPEALYDVLRDPKRLWERRRRHNDFLKVRVGTGVASGRPLNLAEQGTALAPTDPFMQSEAQGVIQRFETIPDMPFALPLDMTGNVSVVGEREDIMRLVRSMVAQFAVFHAPEDAGLAVSYPEEHADDWSWLLWLPQVLDPQRREHGVATRLIAPSPRDLGALLADELRSRSDFASEVRRGMGRREAYQLLRRLLVIHDTHGEVATELVRPDHTVDPTSLGVTVLHLVAMLAIGPLVRKIPTRDHNRVLRVRYLDGAGVLRDILALATEMGYSTLILGSRRLEREDQALVEIDIRFKGRMPLRAAIPSVHTIEGVRAVQVRSDDEQEDDEDVA